MLTEKEKSVLLHISKYGLNASERPFQDIATALNMEENEVLEIIARLKENGIIKKLRAVLNHVNAGYEVNALIVWRVNPDEIDNIKSAVIKNDMISHCYERESQDGFNYNIYTMMHARKEEQIYDFINNTTKDFNVNYEILFTEKELKKEKPNMEELLLRN